MVYTQQLQFTPDQIQVVQQALLAVQRLNRTGTVNNSEVGEVASTILTNPLIAELITQFGIADVQNIEGSSLLIGGAKIGSIPVIRSALGVGAFIDLRDEYGATALHWAAWNNHTDAAIYLISIGADPNIPNNSYGDSPLITSISNENLKITKALVKAGGDINYRDFDGDAPLIIAAARGHLKIVDFLIEKGADVNIQNNNGRTALMWASANNHIAVVTSLLKAKADPNLKSSYYGDTALHYAISNGNNRVVRQLIVGGADFNLPNNIGLSPLTLAARNNKAEEARLLLSAGAEIDKQAEDGDTALMDAVNLGYTDVVKVFLEHCPNLEIYNRNRKTAFHIALGRQLTEIMNLLTAHPTFICSHGKITFSVGETRYDVCLEVKCCEGVWSPTGRTLDTCGSKCRRILAPAGVCTPVPNCPQLKHELEIISSSPNSYQNGYEFVENYGCGVFGTKDEPEVHVCCPTA